MTRKYRVIIEADFEMYASSPSEIKKRLDKIIKHSGFDSKNFELEISRVSQDSEPQVISITQQDTVKQQSAVVDKSQQDTAKQSTAHKRKRRSTKNKSYDKTPTTLDELFEKYTK